MEAMEWLGPLIVAVFVIGVNLGTLIFVLYLIKWILLGG